MSEVAHTVRGMRILHTSDWHIGRSFHGHSTLDALRSVLEAMTRQVRDNDVQVVIVAGDVFDSAVPAAACYTLLSDTLARTGRYRRARDRDQRQPRLLGATRLPVRAAAGWHPCRHRPAEHRHPDHDRRRARTGALLRHPVPRAGARALACGATSSCAPSSRPRPRDGLVRADLAARGGRSVAISHCFAGDVTPHARRRARHPAGRPRRRPAAGVRRSRLRRARAHPRPASSCPSASATPVRRCTTASARAASGARFVARRARCRRIQRVPSGSTCRCRVDS